MPRVSVIIPTFNCASFLGGAIHSALAQTYADYEVIVVDDGSTDETPEVLARFEDDVRCLRQPNRGAIPARKLALSYASGELIAYLDADDMWYPDKLEKQVAFLDAHEDCGLVHSDAAIIDEAGRVLHQRSNVETGREVPRGVCVMDLLRRNHIELSTVVQRRDCLERIGFDERVGGVGDYLQWTLVAMDGTAIGYINEPLAMFRRRRGSMQTDRRRVLQELALMFEILLEEKELAPRFGRQAAAIARTRLAALQRELAVLDRTEGRTADARRRVVGLICKRPLQPDLYVEWLKAFVPPAIAERLRRLRARWA